MRNIHPEPAVTQKEFAGPSQAQFWWNVAFKWKNPLTTMDRLHSEYGPLIRLNSAINSTYLVNDADLIKQILQDNNRNYIKQPIGSAESPLLGNGLLTGEGEFWRRQRRLAQPAFHKKQVDQFAVTMAEATRARLDQWEKYADSGSSFDLANEMMLLTLDIVTRTLFGNHLSEEEVTTINQLMGPILKGTREHIVRSRWIGETPNLPRARRYLKHIEAFDRIIMRLIEERKAAADPGSDLLGMLLSARDEETGEQMSDKQLRDEVMTLFLAGHETTANLMAWCWINVGQHSLVQETLQAEIDLHLGGRAPGLADLRLLPYTEMVLKESMRLYPPAWMISRSPIEQDHWQGETIEAGSQILICTYTLHRSKLYWSNPERFNPSRFANPNDLPHRYAFIPFGGGPRLCIGRQFAMLEATVILAMIMQRVDVRLDPLAAPAEPETAVTLRPKNGVWVQIKKR